VVVADITQAPLWGWVAAQRPLPTKAVQATEQRAAVVLRLMEQQILVVVLVVGGMQPLAVIWLVEQAGPVL
jgi:hypothetical protein